MQRRPRDTGYYLAGLAKVLVLVALSPILLPILLAVLLARWVKGVLLERRFRRTWADHGKVGIFVYSDNPTWKEYIESAILSRVGGKMVALNWSLRSQWKKPKPLEVQLFEHWAGEYTFNPMAIIVPHKGPVQTIRFWQAFRDYKHGRGQELEKQQSLLFSSVDAA